jgi:hypothetical protein
MSMDVEELRDSLRSTGSWQLRQLPLSQRRPTQSIDMSKQPLLPSHINDKHRLSSPAISFPSNTSKKPDASSSSSPNYHSPTSPDGGSSSGAGRHVLAGGHGLERKPGLPKVSREVSPLNRLDCGQLRALATMARALMMWLGLLCSRDVCSA